MNRKYIYFFLTLTVLCFFLILTFVVENKQNEAQAAQSVQENSSLQTYITGTGIVEPASGSILISTPLNRTVEKVDVTVDKNVKKGEILFQLYNQDLKSKLKIGQKKYDESVSNLNRLHLLPQNEDLIIAQETLNKAQATFNEAVIEYCKQRRCTRSREERCLNFYKYQQAEADFFVAQAQFRKVKSGAWQPDFKIAQEQVEQAKAEIEAIEAEIEQTYIKAPLDGTVLQIKIHEGETANPDKTAMILGNVTELHLKVSIDQFNQSKFQSDYPAMAFKRGDNTTGFPLKFLHIEPVMVPKRYLTNDSIERVDTHIFEVIYLIEKTHSNLVVGELMDVYIYIDKK